MAFQRMDRVMVPCRVSPGMFDKERVAGVSTLGEEDTYLFVHETKISEIVGQGFFVAGEILEEGDRVILIRFCGSAGFVTIKVSKEGVRLSTGG